MSIVLVTTPGLSTANSYVTVAEADAYHETRLHSNDWLVSGEVKAAALVMATRLLDAYYSWTGDPLTQPQLPYLPAGAYRAWTGNATSATQSLSWPRVGMLTRNGFPLPSDAIPQELKDATSEFARQLIVADRTLDLSADVQGIKSVKAGPVTIAFKDMMELKVIPNVVHTLLVPSWTTLYGYGARNAVFEVL
jgi:hypothetical protein